MGDYKKRGAVTAPLILSKQKPILLMHLMIMIVEIKFVKKRVDFVWVYHLSIIINLKIGTVDQWSSFH